MKVEATDQAVEAVGTPHEEESLDSIASRLAGEDDTEGETDSSQPEPEADEAAPAEDEDGEPEGDEEENQEEAGQQPEPILIDGVEVTQDELVRGYRREADYTRKTQALAEQRRKLESDQAAITAEREHLAQFLNTAEAQLSQLVEQPVDWDALRQADPIEYGVRFADHQRRLQQLAEVRMRQQQVDAARQQTAAQQVQARVAEESDKLLQAIPDWKDPARRKSELTALYDYGASKGFSREELDAVTDHRAFLLLHKAWKYDQAVQKKQPVTAKSAQAKSPSVAAPGPAGKGKPVKPERAKLAGRLRNSGSIDDAALLIEQLLGD